MPTPRPEMLEIDCAVEKPGAKISRSISSFDMITSGTTRPFSIALARTRSRSIPRPSSAMRIRMRPDLCSADSVSVPSGDLPAARRSSAGSIPWSTALRIRCVSGSPSRSITVLSSSVLSPETSSRTCFPVLAVNSRKMRGTRLKTEPIGWARIAIADSWMSRVNPSSSASSSVAARPSPASRCAIIAWAMTSSPTASINLSSLPSSIRIDWPMAGGAGGGAADGAGAVWADAGGAAATGGCAAGLAIGVAAAFGAGAAAIGGAA